MIEPITTPGKTYAVTSPNGCTVTTDDGKLILTMKAGVQDYFVAPAGKVIVSDDEASVTESYRGIHTVALAAEAGANAAMRAADAAANKAEQEAAKAEAKAALLGDAALKGEANVFTADNAFEADIIGGMQRLPADCLAAIYYAALHWWNNEFDWYKAYAWNEFALSKFPNLTRLLPGTAEPDWSRLNGATHLLTNCPLKAIPDGWTGAGLTMAKRSNEGTFFSGEYVPSTWLTPDLERADWMYANSSFETLPEGTTFEKVTRLSFCFKGNKNLRYLPASMNFPQNINMDYALQSCENLEMLPDCLTLEGTVNVQALCMLCKKITQANSVVGSTVKGWWNAFGGCTSLREMHNIDCAAAVSLDATFEQCQFDKVTTMRILNTMPAWSDEDYPLNEWISAVAGCTRVLTIGIHRDLRQDEEVLAALELAALPKAEGGKGWRVSYTWRGVAGELNAAAAASTYGMRELIYARLREVEGERELEWAHGVLDPDGRTPEELGYEVFRSVEAAREYFGLPEEPLTETE